MKLFHKKKLFVFFLVMGGLIFSGTAHAQCPDFPDPTLDVQTFYEPASYNFMTPLKKIEEIAAQSSDHILEMDRNHPVGLNVGKLGMSAQLTTNIVIAPDGRVCASPAQLVLKVGFSDTKIYVARELPRRSCANKEVLAHEEGHSTIDKQLLVDFKPKLVQFSDAVLREIGVIRHTNAQKAEQEINAYLNDKLQQAIKALNDERSVRQSAHDSVDEYKRLSAVCDGQVGEMLRDYKAKKKAAAGR